MQSPETTEHFDRLYNSQHEIAKTRRRTEQWTLPILRRLGVMSGKILSAGCGNGADVSVLRSRGYDAWGVDVHDASACSHFQLASMTEAPFPDSTFDAVTALEVIEHIVGKDRGMASSEMMRVLKQEGWLIIATPNRRFPVDEHGDPVRVHSILHDYTLSIGELEALFGKANTLTWDGYFAFERFGTFGKWIKSVQHAYDFPMIHRSFLNPHFFLAFRRRSCAASIL
jgi:SAM-dependent methyltransferase